jgi:TolA-binding protein
MIKQNLRSILILSFAGLLMLTSCQEDKKQQLTDQINSLEKTLFENKKGVIDKKEAANMIYSYLQFVDTYPDDSNSPNYLFKAADVSINTFHSAESIKLFDRIIKDYPEYEKVPQALFLKAFTYENYLAEVDSARKYYQLFIEEYPNHAFSNDAQISLQNLGKTPEEIIRGFREE